MTGNSIKRLSIQPFAGKAGRMMLMMLSLPGLHTHSCGRTAVIEPRETEAFRR
jgi:hypothetical protein